MVKKVIILMAAVIATSSAWAVSLIEQVPTLQDNLALYIPYDEGIGFKTHDLANGFDGEIFTANPNHINPDSTIGLGPFTQEGGLWVNPLLSMNQLWTDGKFGKALRMQGIPGEMQPLDVRLLVKPDGEGIYVEPWADNPELGTKVARDWTYSFWVRRPEDFLLSRQASWVNALDLDRTENTQISSDPYSVDWWTWNGGLQYDHLFTFYGQPQSSLGYQLQSKMSAGGATHYDLLGFRLGQQVEGVWYGDGLWHHILISIEGDPLADMVIDPRFVINVYCDGDLVSKTLAQKGGWGWIPTEAFQVGFSTWLKGEASSNSDDIDEVAVWNRLLTTQEIAALAGAAVPLMPEAEFPLPSTQVPDEANLVAWYHFEEASGTTTDDLTRDFTPVDAVFSQGAVWEFSNILLNPFQPFVAGNVARLGETDSGATNDGGHISAAAVAKFGYAELDKGFTLSVWINPDDRHDDSGDDPNKQNWGTIVSKANPTPIDPTDPAEPKSPEGTFMTRLYQGRFELFLNFEINEVDPYSVYDTQFWTDDDVVTPGQWHHVVAIYDPVHPEGYDPDDPLTWGGLREGAKEVRLYVDGFEARTSSFDPLWKGRLREISFDAGTYPFNIGDQWRPFRGMIDDVRLYNKALTDNEVLALYFKQCNPRMSGLSGDLSGDCSVNLDDFGKLSTGWLDSYQLSDLVKVAQDWLKLDQFFPVY